ncbi:multidrug export protein EmrB [mine drainage metagenome]|uniref:Multidrug export protein EmrB n=1 Tax=mine drainage metagenome TaxID=410659 RepID=A0A1J5SYG5_9ZZZZ
MSGVEDPRANRWAVLIIVVLGTFMAILDASVVNVALPHMMSSFGVDREQIEWVATGYMLTSAVVMPFMGWIATRVDYKFLYLSCLALFTLGSVACAFSWSYGSLIAFRVIQALGGGGIQPTGMAIVAELFEPHERGRALGIYGTGIQAGPALGPTLGGYLTDTFNWRTIFSVNLPFGIVVLILGMIIMRPLKSSGARRTFDFAGFGFLAIGLVAGLTALSNGQIKGWDSSYIHLCEALTVIGFVMFVAVELAVEHPLIDLRLFLVRNFSLSVILTIVRAIGLFGSVFLFPLFLENLMGYTPVDTGLWMIPGAIAVALSMPVAGWLADRYKPSYLIAIGCAMLSMYLFFFAQLDPLSGSMALVWPQVLRGVGLSLLVAPLIAAALNSVGRKDVAMASSFLSVSQNVGGAIGIAMINTFVTDAIQRHAVRIGERIPVESARFFSRLGLRAESVIFRHEPGIVANPQVKVMFVAGRAIERHAQVMAYDNGFMLAALIVLVVGVPLGLLFKPARHHGNGNKEAVAGE